MNERVYIWVYIHIVIHQLIDYKRLMAQYESPSCKACGLSLIRRLGLHLPHVPFCSRRDKLPASDACISNCSWRLHRLPVAGFFISLIDLGALQLVGVVHIDALP